MPNFAKAADPAKSLNNKMHAMQAREFLCVER